MVCLKLAPMLEELVLPTSLVMPVISEFFNSICSIHKSKLKSQTQ